MNIIACARELQPGPRKVCLAIGMFDGVHLGHQQVIRQTITDARQHEALALVVTFDRHPKTVVAPARASQLIYSLSHKLRVLAALGVDTALVIRFDPAFSRQPAEAFMRGLARDLGRLHSVCVGSHFTFGHQGRGNVALLKAMGAELNFQVHGLAAVALGGKPLSSTRIREAIRAGHLDAAAQMLGRGYSLRGPVVRGDGLGRQIGFPTANLEIVGLVLPPPGVYAAQAEARGRVYRAVLNLGFRPTVSPNQAVLRLEAHLLDFAEDLYGEELELAFVKQLRGEQHFPSLAALQAQIARDVAAARQWF